MNLEEPISNPSAIIMRFTREVGSTKERMLELLAAAYLIKTGLRINEVVIVERMDTATMTTSTRISRRAEPASVVLEPLASMSGYIDTLAEVFQNKFGFDPERTVLKQSWDGLTVRFEFVETP